MALPGLASSSGLQTALQAVQSTAYATKSQAQNYLAAIQAGPVTADAIFQSITQIRQMIATLQQYQSIAGLNAYATAQLPGYAGTLTTDIAATISAAQAVITWVVTNFPKDSGGFAQAHTLNADGSLTSAVFTSAQLAGLQTVLQALIATIN